MMEADAGNFGFEGLAGRSPFPGRGLLPAVR